MEIAQTILLQLGGNKFITMTGAKNCTAHPDGLSFRISSRMTKNKCNYVRIFLEATDTYLMQFGKVHGSQFRVIETIDGLYNDMIRNTFEVRTGLYCTLGTLGR